MIIDFHAHLIDRTWLPGPWLAAFEKAYVSPLSPTGLEDMFDPTGQKLLRAMDRTGVDLAVIQTLDFGLALGEAETSIQGQLEAVGRIVARRPDRLAAFVGVDPRRPEAIDLVRTALDDWGYKGIKLHPGAGFPPNPDTVGPLVELAAERSLPVMVHTGPAFGPLTSRYCRPYDLDEILTAFPETPIIAAHLGGGWLDQLAWLARAKPNLYSDVSLHQTILRIDPDRFRADLRFALDMFGPTRLLFGTDHPFGDRITPGDRFIRAVREQPFASAEIKALLGANAARLLHLQPKD